MKQRISSIALGAILHIVWLFALPAVAQAARPSAGIETFGTVVSDSDLATMRGKFIAPDNISYFGVQMASSWQGPDGITTSATLLFSVNFASGAGNLDGAVPSVMIDWNRDCNACGDPSMDVSNFGGAASNGYVALVPGGGSIPVGGLNDVHGAAQSQQIAGSDNRVHNDMRIAIIPASAIVLGSTGMTPVTSSQRQQFADGKTIDFIIDGNSIALALTSGSGPDAIRQSVNGDLGQAAQHVLLSTNSNMIQNGMGIIVGFNELQSAGRMNMQHAMSAMKGHGF